MIDLATIESVLDDLFTKRHADLLKSRAGQFYEPDLAEIRTGIHALPSALKGTPLADELRGADKSHDGLGGVIFFSTEAVRRDPEASAALRGAAERVRAAFVPAIDELNDSYLEEAQRASKRRPLLTDSAMVADLGLIPVAEHGTLLEVATKFLDAGDALMALLSDRGDVAIPDRTAAAALRPRAVGALNELRKKLAKEVKKDATLPQNLEMLVFGFYDTVVKMAAGGGAKAAPAVAVPAPAAGVPPTA